MKTKESMLSFLIERGLTPIDAEILIEKGLYEETVFSKDSMRLDFSVFVVTNDGYIIEHARCNKYAQAVVVGNKSKRRFYLMPSPENN